MRDALTGTTAPQMMVLGLVIRKRDTTSGVARRLADGFASARFSGSSAYGNLPLLEAKGFVRVVERGPPDVPARDRYEATPAGVDHFRSWFHRTELPPIIRDAVQCKLEFIEPKDLAVLIRLVRDEEEACTAACDLACARVLREQESRRHRGKPEGWHGRLRAIQVKDEAMLWGAMSKRLERLGDELENLLDEVRRVGRAG